MRLQPSLPPPSSSLPCMVQGRLAQALDGRSDGGKSVADPRPSQPSLPPPPAPLCPPQLLLGLIPPPATLTHKMTHPPHTLAGLLETYSVVIRGIRVFITGDHLRCHPVRGTDERVPTPHRAVQLGTDPEVDCRKQREREQLHPRCNFWGDGTQPAMAGWLPWPALGLCEGGGPGGAASGPRGIQKVPRECLAAGPASLPERVRSGSDRWLSLLRQGLYPSSPRLVGSRGKQSKLKTGRGKYL